jgi:hypothetical protein
MKYLVLSLSLLLLMPVTNIKAQSIDKKYNTYFHFGLNGPRENGVFNIEVEENSKLNVFHKAIITPTFQVADFGILGDENIKNIIIKFPPKVGLFELIESNNDNYVFTISVNNRTYMSKSVSVHITELVKGSNPMQLDLVKGKFEGVMKHSFTEDSIEKEETYTIYGDFQYIAPKYQKKLKKKE